MNSNLVRLIVGPMIVAGSIAAVCVYQHREMTDMRAQLAELETARSAMQQSIDKRPPGTPAPTFVPPFVQPMPNGADPNAQPVAAPAQVTSDPGMPTRTVDEVRDIIAGRFEADRVDRSRAGVEAYRTISSAVSELDIPGVRLETLECREQMCMMKLDFRDMEVDKSAMRALFRGERHIPMGGVMVPERKVDADGHVMATVYIARQGDVQVD
jgi:hypothetical protein